MVVFGYIMLMRLSLATFLTSLRRVNQAESSVVFSLFELVMFFPDLLGSDLAVLHLPHLPTPSLGGG